MLQGRAQRAVRYIVGSPVTVPSSRPWMAQADNLESVIVSTSQKAFCRTGVKTMRRCAASSVHWGFPFA